MTILLRKTRTGFFTAMIGLMIMSVLTPVLTLANENLEAGDDAVVLRDSYLYSDFRDDANIEAEVVVDTPVTVEDGPLYDDQGAPWYRVRIFEDRVGFMPGKDLEGDTIETAPVEAEIEEPAPVEEEPAPEQAPALPWQQPIDYGVATTDVTCRAAASTGGAEITVVASGATVEITGSAVWEGDLSFTPVNCAGVGGFIASDYIARGGADEEPIAEDVIADEPVVEEPVAEAPAPEVPAVDETQVEQPVTDADVETAPEVAEPVTEEVADTAPEVAEPVEETVTEESAAEAPAPEQQPALDPIATAWAAEAVNCRIAPSTGTEAIAGFAAGEAIAVTGDAFEAEGLSWTPVNCGPGGGFVSTEFLAWEAPATDEAAEPNEVVEDTAPEVAEPTEDATEVAEDATEEPTEPTENATEDVAEDTTGEAAEPTEDATEEVTEPTEDETDPTEEVTEEAAEPTEDATEAVEDTADEATDDTIATFEERESEMPVDDTAIIGTAEVDGTNGTLACRVAPADDSAVIALLPEGMNVFVLSEPDANGWMSIVCANEVGYAPAQNLYSGGNDLTFDPATASNATVTGTGGGGLNCRSGASTSYSVVGWLAEGSAVNLTGKASGVWVELVCGGRNAWAHGEYLTAASAPSTGGDSTGDSGGTSTGMATVVNTEGQSLRCRSGAGTQFSTITYLAAGSTVALRSGSQGDWQAVTCANQQGFAHSGFLSTNGSGSDSGNTDDDDNDGGSQTPSTGNVTVSGTGGARLNCRTGAGTNFPAVTSVAEGTVLSVRGAAENNWLPVVCNGSNLWVSADFVTAGGSTPDPAPEEPKDPGTGSGDTGKVTGEATVVNTDGQSLRCRSGAGTNHSTITYLAAGSKVSLRDGSEGDWQAVICAGQNGFAHKGFLSTGGSSTPTTPTPEPEPEEPSGFVNGDHARTTANLNLRYDPYVGNNVATVAQQGTVVKITGGHAGNNYYPVDYDGLKGYMSADYLVKTDEALSDRGGSATPTDPPTSGGGGGTATGNAIADYAMGYLGYPYVWATHGPASFDCTGFTYWVIYNVTGKNIWYGLWTQIAAGSPVSRSALQPGDLVFFQNTYKAGLSHSGIYIGNNKFIHAQNESTGVVISDLDSSYYGPRWYGARRVH